MPPPYEEVAGKKYGRDEYPADNKSDDESNPFPAPPPPAPRSRPSKSPITPTTNTESRSRNPRMSPEALTARTHTRIMSDDRVRSRTEEVQSSKSSSRPVAKADQIVIEKEEIEVTRIDQNTDTEVVDISLAEREIQLWRSQRIWILSINWMLLVSSLVVVSIMMVHLMLVLHIVTRTPELLQLWLSQLMVQTTQLKVSHQ
ncbi:unnamed protein product [Ambrosiozyma monospora]|uniref:Unnamed protein product n=1 Tax=Ambrosiozyma monospora TaxID=43982 RepID=A0A9W6T631_AMBMO|nr:unnamed protein product [Ambrosiozyma monospora]